MVGKRIHPLHGPSSGLSPTMTELSNPPKSCFISQIGSFRLTSPLIPTLSPAVQGRSPPCLGNCFFPPPPAQIRSNRAKRMENRSTRCTARARTELRRSTATEGWQEPQQQPASAHEEPAEFRSSS